MNRLRSTSDLEALRARIRQESDPNKIVVRICMTGCRAYGAEEARDAFVREIASRGLEKKVEVRETGCHGFCARAPVAAIDPLDIFYQQFSAEDVPEIVSETIEKGRVDRAPRLPGPGDAGAHLPQGAISPFIRGRRRSCCGTAARSTRAASSSI